MIPASILPITALIRRELVSSLRQTRYFYVVLVAIAAASLTVISFWPGEHPSPWQMKNASQGIFVLLGLTLGLGAALSVPALSGSSIVSEREEETFEMLAMTTAKPWHVLIAKLVNSAGHYLLLVVALAPFAACAFFLVGMNTSVLWRTLLIVSTTALSCAAAGVLCSAVLDRPIAAVGVSYLAMLVILGLPWMMIAVVLELFGVRVSNNFIQDIAICCIPVVAFAQALDNSGSSWTSLRGVEVCSALNVVLALALIFVAHVLIRRKWGITIDRVPASTPATRRSKPGIRSRSRSFDDKRNPVYLRECWYEYPLRGWMLALQINIPAITALLACVLIVILYATGPSSSDEDALIAFVGWHFLEAMLLPLLLASLTANMFTKEHERHNIDALRMTLMRPFEIFGGKLMASFNVGLMLFLAACAGSLPLFLTLPFVPTGPAGGENIVYVFVMLAECLAVTWIVTAFCSIVARRMASALVLSFVVGAMMLGGNAIVTIVIGEGLGWYRVGESMVGALSPYFAYGLWIDSPTNKDAIYGWYASHMMVAGIMLLLGVLAAARFAARHMQDR